MLIALDGLVVRDDNSVPLDSVQIQDRLPNLQFAALRVIAPQLGEFATVEGKNRPENHTIVGEKILHLGFPRSGVQKDQRSNNQYRAEWGFSSGELREPA